MRIHQVEIKPYAHFRTQTILALYYKKTWGNGHCGLDTVCLKYPHMDMAEDALSVTIDFLTKSTKTTL